MISIVTCSKLCFFVQSFRDSLSTSYKSSTQAKKLRRRQIQTKLDDEIENFLKYNQDVAGRMKGLARRASSGGEFSTSKAITVHKLYPLILSDSSKQHQMQKWR